MYVGFLSDGGVDVLRYLLGYASDLALGWVNEAACGSVVEVVFMVFEGYEGLLFCHAFSSVVDM